MDTLLVVLPVFGAIALGYGAGRFGLLSERAGEGLEEFVYVVAIPALIVRSLTGATEPIQSPWGYWAAYFLGVAATWSTMSLVLMGLLRESGARRRWPASRRASATPCCSGSRSS